MLLQKNIVKKYPNMLNDGQPLNPWQQDEWEDAFNERVSECKELSAQIKATDEEVDYKVFDLYGLTEEERRIVMEG